MFMTPSEYEVESMQNRWSSIYCNIIKHGYWNWITGEYIFHDPDYDEPPYNDGTFGITKLDLNEIVKTNDPEQILVGYHSDKDDDIDREEAVRRIFTEDGWHRLDSPYNGIYLKLAGME